MQIEVNQSRVELVAGDITDQTVHAIVNAANSRLAGGGGVDGAIHRRGGPSVMEETRRRYPDGCPTGSAVISGAGHLSARYVIHAVGPVWSGGKRHERESLAGAYHRALELATEHDCESVAFPALSTGAYAYPLDEAADVAIATTCAFLETHTSPRVVRFVLWGQPAMDAFVRAMEQREAGRS